MRSVRSCLLLLLVSLLFCGTCSALIFVPEPELDFTPAEERVDFVGYAEDFEQGKLGFFGVPQGAALTMLHYLYVWDGSGYVKLTSASTGFNLGNSASIPDRSHTIDTSNNAQGLMRDYVAIHANGNVLFYTGEAFSIDIPSVSVYNGNFSAYTNLTQLKNITVRATDTAGAERILEDATVEYRYSTVDGSPSTSINFRIDVPYLDFDVTRVTLSFDTNLDAFGTYSTSRYTGVAGQIQINSVEGEEPEEPAPDYTGFFGSIVEWLQGIWQGITGLGDKIAGLGTKIGETISAIQQLPSLIWNKMKEGLQTLFVPTSEEIENLQGGWKWLLETRFGAIYQAGEMLFSVGESIHDASEQGTIEFPQVSVSLAGADWTFGGYEVDVVPDGFEWLANTIKGLIDIVCTLAFVNMLKRRYSELLGGGVDA